MRAFFALFVVFVASAAQAQDVVAGRFEDLGTFIKQGDELRVTTEHGVGDIRGRVLDVSPSALTILVNRQRRTVAESEVLRISREHHAKVGLGIAIGAAAGAGFGLLSFLASSGCDDWKTCLFGGMALTGGMGGAVGGWIADARVTQRLIYRKQEPDTTSLSLSPIVDAHRKGAMVSVRW